MYQIKGEIEKLTGEALKETLKSRKMNLEELPEVSVERSKEDKFGDYSTNIALLLGKKINDSPVNVASDIIRHIKNNDFFSEIKVVPPGFINFFVKNGKLQGVLKAILDENKKFGYFKSRNEKVQVEFVSANPTGPLHVGHGRGAAIGDCIANVLSAYGYEVCREYYLNDAGAQIDTLGVSVKYRYLELLDQKENFPDKWNEYPTYQGEYVKEIAREIKNKYGDGWREKEIGVFSRFAVEGMTRGIKEDLEIFGVSFDRWFKESELHQKKEIDKILKILEKKGYIEHKDGAVWFKSSLFGDAKDRVIIRQNNAPTYLASDIAYHAQKFKHYNQVVNVWGADHHGYIQRMKAAAEALGYKPEDLRIVLVQLVKLSREGEIISMSTRSGEFITLRELLDEVGKDAARFIFMTRRSDAQLEFDLELAKKKSLDNPVYYIQYAHARLCSILRLAEEKKINLQKLNTAGLELLQQKEELNLIKLLVQFPDVIEDAARALEPHRLTVYLMEIAQSFHSFYNIHRVITDEADLTLARLSLIKSIQIVIENALGLLGVAAPEKM